MTFQVRGRSGELVSIIVPNYNHERYLHRRIRSILTQTHQNFELILLDDASTDGSIEVLKTYTGDDRVQLVVNDVNSGSPFPQWNRGVAMARGELIWIAEADDDAEPTLLEELVPLFSRHPNVVLAYCQSFAIDEHGRRLYSYAESTKRLSATRWCHSFITDGREEARRYLIFQNTIPNASAVVFRRSAYQRSGGAPKHMRLCGDWIVWAALAMQGDVAFINAPLNLFRQHSGTVRSSTSVLRELEERAEVIGTIKRRLAIARDVQRSVARRLLRDWMLEFRRPHGQPTLVAGLATAKLMWQLAPHRAVMFVLLFMARLLLGPSVVAPLRNVWLRLKRAASRGRVSAEP